MFTISSPHLTRCSMQYAESSTLNNQKVTAQAKHNSRSSCSSYRLAAHIPARMQAPSDSSDLLSSAVGLERFVEFFQWSWTALFLKSTSISNQMQYAESSNLNNQKATIQAKHNSRSSCSSYRLAAHIPARMQTSAGRSSERSSDSSDFERRRVGTFVEFLQWSWTAFFLKSTSALNLYSMQNHPT